MKISSFRDIYLFSRKSAGNRDSRVTIDTVFSEIVNSRKDSEKERVEVSTRIARNSFNKWRNKAKLASTPEIESIN